MAAITSPRRDVVTHVHRQHETIRRLFDDVRNTAPAERAAAFQPLVRLLAVHETAEEMVVYPALLLAGSAARAVVRERKSEEDAAKNQLADLEGVDASSRQFLTGLDALREVVLEHAEAEEREVFPLLEEHRDKMKDTVVWNVEKGLRLDGPQVGRAIALRSDVYRRMREFLQRYEFLLLPVNQVLPFPASQPYVTEIGGAKLDSYIDWMKSCWYITVTSHPAISVPAGFTDDEPALPVGLQIVGRYRDHLGVLQLPHAFEQETRVGKRRPPPAATAGWVPPRV